ncbi:MAG: HAD family hydrolase [Solirubrobacteraceae bacterium]
MILLDALGTLVGLEPPWQPLRSLLLERSGVEVALEDCVRALSVEMRHYREQCIRARDAQSLAALREECAELVGRELSGAEVDTQTLLDAMRFRAYPEVAGALAALRARGERIVVVSNWDVSLHEVLARCGLAALVDRVLTSAEFGAAKPAPEIFHAALDGADPASARHIGDSVREDVCGARACGITALLLRRDDATLLAGSPDADSDAKAPPPDVRVISGLDELAA